jgi:hypothetical protein
MEEAGEIKEEGREEVKSERLAGGRHLVGRSLTWWGEAPERPRRFTGGNRRSPMTWHG